MTLRFTVIKINAGILTGPNQTEGDPEPERAMSLMAISIFASSVIIGACWVVGVWIYSRYAMADTTGRGEQTAEDQRRFGAIDRRMRRAEGDIMDLEEKETEQRERESYGDRDSN